MQIVLANQKVINSTMPNVNHNGRLRKHQAAAYAKTITISTRSGGKQLLSYHMIWIAPCCTVTAVDRQFLPYRPSAQPSYSKTARRGDTADGKRFASCKMFTCAIL